MKNNPKGLFVNVMLFVTMFTFFSAFCSKMQKGNIIGPYSTCGKGGMTIVSNQAVLTGLVRASESDFGMQRIVLDAHFSEDGKYKDHPILSQDDFKSPNTIYVLRHDFVLVENISMPPNCIIDFEGGSLSGGTISGNNTSIKPADYSIFNDCIIKSFNLPYVDPRWVGAIPDFNERDNLGTDNSVYFQRAYDNIVVYHPGVDMFIVGKYLISQTVEFGMQCHLRGVHNNTRGLVMRNLHAATGSSSSLIAVGNCPAFRIVGDKKRERTWADLSIEHIKFLGINKSKSIAIQYEASGSPTRPATIEKCEATNLLYFFSSRAKENTTIGNLTFRENNIYNCEKAIFAISDPVQNMGMTALKIENNVIEHNGDKCIYLSRCFGPIIIDNNILEGESNPIYITSSYPTETKYVISNNYFEQPENNDKKIHIDGVISKDGGNFENARFLTNVEIFGNTSPYGFAIELNGVVIKRLDRIDTPSKWPSNYSSFTKCLFDGVELSDVYTCQFKDWNFSTRYPSSIYPRQNVIIGKSGNDLLSFDDCKGNTHTNKLTGISVKVTEDTGRTNMLITKLNPHFVEKSKRIIIKYKLNNQANYFGVDFPREIPYYAFLFYNNGGRIKDKNYIFEVNVYNEKVDIEMSNIAIYMNVDGGLFKYPYIYLPY